MRVTVTPRGLTRRAINAAVASFNIGISSDNHFPDLVFFDA